MSFHVVSFLDRGYDFVPLDIDRLPIAEVFAGLELFLAQPLSEKMRWHIPQKGYYDPDPGYFRKEGKWDPEIEELSDEKEYFHWSPSLVQELIERSNDPLTETDIAPWADWLNQLRVVYDACMRHLQHVFQEMDAALPRPVLYERREIDSILRIMAYDAGKPGKPHVDKSAVTFHVASTHPGYIMRGTHVDSPPGTVLAFGSRKLAHVLQRPELGVLHEAAPYHGANGERRRVIVLFGHLHVPELRDPPAKS